MSFLGPAHCPECPPWTARNGKTRLWELDCIENNYSGCGVDLGECPQCHKVFQVSYKVDEIVRF